MTQLLLGSAQQIASDFPNLEASMLGLFLGQNYQQCEQLIRQITQQKKRLVPLCTGIHLGAAFAQLPSQTTATVLANSVMPLSEQDCLLVFELDKKLQQSILRPASELMESFIFKQIQLMRFLFENQHMTIKQFVHHPADVRAKCAMMPR